MEVFGIVRLLAEAGVVIGQETRQQLIADAARRLGPLILCRLLQGDLRRDASVIYRPPSPAACGD
jgi:hypothetical protein